MISGAHCGSPALKGQSYCHHHYSLRRLLPKRFVAWDGFVNDNVHGTRFIPMPLLEDALSIQTAYMQIIHGVLSGQMQMPQARIALAAVRAAARNLPWVKTERAAMAGEQSELARDVSETREKVWSNDDYRTLHDNTGNAPATVGVPADAPAVSTGAPQSGARDTSAAQATGCSPGSVCAASAGRPRRRRQERLAWIRGVSHPWRSWDILPRMLISKRKCSSLLLSSKRRLHATCRIGSLRAPA